MFLAVRALAVTLTLLVPLMSSAATTGDPAEGLRRQEERQRLEENRARAPIDPSGVPADDAVALPPEALPVEADCVRVTAMQLAGDDARRFSWLAPLAERYAGRCIGVEGLRAIASALQGKLIELGYVTSRIAFGSEPVKDGVLSIQVFAGRVGSLQLVDAADGAADNRWGTWRNAFPVAPGDLLNSRDLEQGVEQMKRLPSQSVGTEITPGTVLGTSDVRILRQAGGWRDRLHGGLSLDNAGQPATGRTTGSLNLSFDNPLGLNDIVHMGMNSNLEHAASDHRSQSWSAGYAIPWGYDTFSINQSRSRYAQMVQGTSARFLSTGNSASTELRWERTLLRTGAFRTGGTLAVSTRRAQGSLDDVELLTNRRRTTQFELGLTHRQLIGRADLDLQLAYRRGTPWKGAEPDFVRDEENQVTLRPRIWTLSANWQQPFSVAGRDWAWHADLRGQATGDTTLSADQFSIGGRYSVRGFDGDAVLLSESGYVLRNEVSTTIDIPGLREAAWFGAIDAGRVWGPGATQLVGDRLAGIATGLRGKWERTQLDITLATPLYRPHGFTTSRWNVYAALAVAF